MTNHPIHVIPPRRRTRACNLYNVSWYATNDAHNGVNVIANEGTLSLGRHVKLVHEGLVLARRDNLVLGDIPVVQGVIDNVRNVKETDVNLIGREKQFEGCLVMHVMTMTSVCELAGMSSKKDMIFCRETRA